MQELVAKITKGLINLPGDRAHLEMTPYRNSIIIPSNKNIKKGAVLILLYPENNTVKFPLILRNTYDGAHSGQVGLPGGKQENNDNSLEHTALRETYEEIGVLANSIEIIGQLSNLYIPVSNFMVYPFVGYSSTPIKMTPDTREVVEIYPTELSDVNNSRIKNTQVIINSGLKLKTPYFDLHNQIVWGATAAILNELRWILNSKA